MVKYMLPPGGKEPKPVTGKHLAHALHKQGWTEAPKPVRTAAPKKERTYYSDYAFREY